MDSLSRAKLSSSTGHALNSANVQLAAANGAQADLVVVLAAMPVLHAVNGATEVEIEASAEVATAEIAAAISTTAKL